jgi:hypothetical protein
MAPGLLEIPPAGSPTAVAVAMTFSGTLTKMYIRNSTPGTDNSEQISYTVYKNNVATGLSVALFSSDPSNFGVVPVPFVEGDLIAVSIEPDGTLTGTPAMNVIASIAFTSP